MRLIRCSVVDNFRTEAVELFGQTYRLVPTGGGSVGIGTPLVFSPKTSGFTALFSSQLEDILPAADTRIYLASVWRPFAPVPGKEIRVNGFAFINIVGVFDRGDAGLE